MPELIDREQAGKNICKYCASNAYCKEDDCMVYQGLRDTPTIQIEAEPVRKPKMSDADRKECEEWCKDCEHIEMCAWYPFGGCDFRLLPKPEQPTIEPEVRHGRWVMNNPYGIKCCSECGYGQSIGAENYCPNCGARMYGGADNG